MDRQTTPEIVFSVENISKTYEERVRQTSGRGIDRISVAEFEKTRDAHFSLISRKCTNSTYRFSPYLQKLIIKGPNKPPRSISIPVIRDKIVLSILNTELQNVFPTSVKRELPNYKVRNLALQLTRLDENTDLHKTDIAAYYDKINHDLLFKKLQVGNINDALLILIKRAIKNKTVHIGYHKETSKDLANTIGVPQGLPISNILAEIYLKETDELFRSHCLYYDRYVDDIIAVTKGTFDFKTFCRDTLTPIGLELNPDKTSLSCQETCISYLGYTIYGTTVSVCQNTLERYYRSIALMFARLRKAIYIDTRRKTNQIGAKKIKKAFVEDLNIKLTGAKFQNKRYGWLQYFSEINDIRILYQIDNFVRDNFKRCNVFKSIPQKIKKASRAFYELKYNWRDTTYIHNYEVLDFKEKRKWLTNRGLAAGTFTEDTIDRLYAYHVGRFLNQIEKDMGVDYKI